MRTSGRFVSHRWVEIHVDERPHSGNRFQKITFICERSDGFTWNRASRWGMAGFDCSAATDVRIEWALVESSI